MADEPLHSTKWLRLDPPGRQRPFATPADTDGKLDWDKATRLAYRPAWAIRSRRGALTAFGEFLRMFRRK